MINFIILKKFDLKFINIFSLIKKDEKKDKFIKFKQEILYDKIKFEHIFLFNILNFNWFEKLLIIIKPILIKIRDLNKAWLHI